MSERVLVIGAGPAGLATAIACQRAGIPVDVYERATELKEVGAGMGAQTNAMKALKRIGVEDLEGMPIEWQDMYAANGTRLARVPMGEVSRECGLEGLSVHRADLQSALLNAVDRDDIHLGAPCVSVEADDEGVTARFADGSEQRGAVLVGADGINSVVRKAILGDTPPRYSGFTCWRTVMTPPPGETIIPLDSIRQYFGRPSVFGIYPITRGRMHWAGIAPAPEGERDAPGEARRAAGKAFRDFDPAVTRLIEMTPEELILRTDIYDRDPADHWSSGRMTIVGDAAHATTPFLGQGAGIAMEDGVALVKNLALVDSLRDTRAVELALRAYEDHRRPRTEKIVLGSRQMGKMISWDRPPRTWIRDQVLRRTPERVWRRRLRESLAYEV